MQVRGRHWIIQDSDGRVVDSVPKGSVGLVGIEPVIRPGGAVSYMSGAKLPTSSYGSMHGSFQCVRKGSPGADHVPDQFDAIIDPFLLK